MIDKISDGLQLLEEKSEKEQTQFENEESYGDFISFVTKLEAFCEDEDLPLPYIHIVTDDHFPEFIRDKWQELYLSNITGSAIDFGNTPFGHLIDWRTGIEEAKEDYYKFVFKDKVYWVNI